ncbi:MAG TPA: ATP-binding protein [Verrucomicrobiae bacterium]|jgi:two-component system, NtrC family, sensor kinase|nr:ATP-binding protein [Verrucomicrobiae bacterium]
MAEIRHRILIVDDKEQNRYILSRLLQRAGYECDQAATGREALEKIASVPDVAIVDVHLPDVSGFSLCQKIKADGHTAQVSVLQISASFVSPEDKAQALEAGADGYLTHPIDGVVLIATVRSLIRLREAEVLAREAAGQWQSTFDALSEGLAFVDMSGKIARFNHAFAAICDHHASCKVDADAFELLQAIVGTDKPLRYTGEGRYSADFVVDRRTVRITVDRVKVRGDEIGRVVVLADITDRRVAEYALRTAEKLAATGKLAHAIAHEINNPLEALTNLLYLAGSVERTSDFRDYLAKAEIELKRITRITRQSLSFHRDTQHPVRIDVGTLVGEVVDLYRQAAAARKVRIAFEQQSPLAIHGFPGQLAQVFGNLLRNATDAAPANSEVCVRVRSAHRAGREGTRITIHDKGSGIPVSVQQQMYDPFFTTKELRGSGLGLWVSKTLVIRHSGTIRFRSSTREGASGTTFEVFLPVKGLNPASE